MSSTRLTQRSKSDVHRDDEGGYNFTKQQLIRHAVYWPILHRPQKHTSAAGAAWVSDKPLIGCYGRHPAASTVERGPGVCGCDGTAAAVCGGDGGRLRRPAAGPPLLLAGTLQLLLSLFLCTYVSLRRCCSLARCIWPTCVACLMPHPPPRGSSHTLTL